MIPLILTIGVMCHGTIAYDYYKFVTQGDDFLNGETFFLMIAGVVFFWVSTVTWSLT